MVSSHESRKQNKNFITIVFYWFTTPTLSLNYPGDIYYVESFQNGFL